MTIRSSLLIIGTVLTLCFECLAQKAIDVNINDIAPNLPVLTEKPTGSDDRKIFHSQMETWMENNYSEFDTVRFAVLAMFLDNTHRLVIEVNGVVKEAEPVYRLSGWEMEYGLTEEQWAPIYARIMEYRSSHPAE